MLGRFLAPASRLDEFALATGRSRPELGVVIDTLGVMDTLGAAPRADQVQASAALAGKYAPTAVEALAAGRGPLIGTVAVLLQGLALLPHETAAYVELPRGDALADWPLAIATLGAARTAGRNVGAKIRCAEAGLAAAPTDLQLAQFVVECSAAGTPFKATAGLHHAIRHTQQDGLERHGFLNLLHACALAQRAGTDARAVAGALAERDAAVVVAGISALTLAEATRVRTDLLVGFGCCAPGEPIEDLSALGLLEGL